MIDDIVFSNNDFDDDFEVGELKNFDISQIDCQPNSQINDRENLSDIFWDTQDDLKSLLPIFENLLNV